MNPVSNHLIFILILLSYLSHINGQAFNWENAMPEKEGLSSEKLLAMKDTLASHNTTSILVLRNDKIVLEWYAPGWDRNRQHGTASMAKAIVGGMSLALALMDGKMKVDDPACNYIPEWKNDPQKSKITIRQLATHSSGIEDAELSERDIAEAKAKGIVIKDKHMDIPGWKGNFWRKDPDPFTMARDHAPVIFTPGTAFHYSNPGMAMLSYAITSSYRGTRHKDVRTLLRERIYKPIGLNANEWSIGYGQTYNVDGLELVANWGGGSFTPRAVARIGLFMMHQGEWDGKKLIRPGIVKQMVNYAGTPLPPRENNQPSPASGLAWWNNFDGVWARAPKDLFLGSGAGNQTLIVIPSLKIVIVRNGEQMNRPEKGEGHFYGVEKYIINPLMDALKSE